MTTLATLLKELDCTEFGLIHADEMLYPLLLQALYPTHYYHTQSYMALVHRVWCDPSPAQIVFLPDWMQEKWVSCQGFLETLNHIYPPDHPEYSAFLNFHENQQDVWQTRALYIWIRQFEEAYKLQQRQHLFEQGVRVVSLVQDVEHPGPHMVLLSHAQAVPTYGGEVRVIVCDTDSASIMCHPGNVSALSGAQENNMDPGSAWLRALSGMTIPVNSIRLLFNEPELFFERYVLKIRPPYHPTNHLGTRAVRQYLLEGISPKINTAFDQHQLDAIKMAWEEFKSRLPNEVTWNLPVSCRTNTQHAGPGSQEALRDKLLDKPTIFRDDTVNMHGTIDLLWNDGLYLITRSTPPSRAALLNGIEPELPILAALYHSPLTHLGYIHVKGYGEDAIQITRYTNPQELILKNIQKLDSYHTPKEAE